MVRNVVRRGTCPVVIPWVQLNDDDLDERLSWEDSERFEEDSLGSWLSEPESLCQNWRGWSEPTPLSVASDSVDPADQSLSYTGGISTLKIPAEGRGVVLPLVELAARVVARFIPFEVVERFYPPVPEQLQLRIAFWSFPASEKDIRLYSCLANGNDEEFDRGESLYVRKAVENIIQIGFHLSATVNGQHLSMVRGVSTPLPEPTSSAKGAMLNSAASSSDIYNVSITIDRRRVTCCVCTCSSSSASWCRHVVAACLYRIHKASAVPLRAPVSESLSRLKRDQLQKFAQYLISELPRQVLPTAQKLLDELLTDSASINALCGAPDPTAGAAVSDVTRWCLIEGTLHENIRKILLKFCIPSPTVFSDVNYLTSSAPPAASEWLALLRPLRGREPEGLWNLLSIVREMYRRRDSNAIALLTIITEECLNCNMVIFWWFLTKLSHSFNGSHVFFTMNSLLAHGKSAAHVTDQQYSSQYSCSSLLDEIVTLWHLAVMNPRMSATDRRRLSSKLCAFHLRAVRKVCKVIESMTISSSRHSGGANGGAGNQRGINATMSANALPDIMKRLNLENAPFLLHVFPGFRRAIASCHHDWTGCQLVCVAMAKDGRMQKGVALSSDLHAAAVRASSASGSSVPVDCEPSVRRRTVSSDAVGAQLLPLPVLRNMPVKNYGGSGGGVCWKPSMSVGGQEMRRSAFRSCSNADGGDTAGDDDRENHKEKGEDSSNEEACSLRCYSSPSPVIVDPYLYSDDSTSTSDDTSTCLSSLHDQLSSEILPEELYDLDEFDGDQNREEGSRNLNLPSALVIKSADEPGACINGAGEASSTRSPVRTLYDSLLAARPEPDPTRVSFARCEALYAHGYFDAACQFAVCLVDNIIQNPPDLMVDIPPPVALTLNAPFSGQLLQKGAQNNAAAGAGNARKRRKCLDVPLLLHPKAVEVNDLACELLTQVLFLLDVLLQKGTLQHLAFRLGLFILQLPRQPASSKFAEVKMNNLECEIIQKLERIALTSHELEVVRKKARDFVAEYSASRACAVLPLSLASYLFDCLCIDLHKPSPYHVPQDEQLGFDVAITALSMKSTVSEGEYPLLHEGLRRQKGDLALALLLRYKDVPEKIVRIMDRILDRDLHQMYRCRSSNAPHFFPDVPESGRTSTMAEADRDEAEPSAAGRTGAECGTAPADGATCDDQPCCSYSRVLPPPPRRKASLASVTSSTATGGADDTDRGISAQASDNDDQSHSSEESYCVASDLNLPSEAQAHFMMELAKRLLIEAGGNHSSSIFTNPQGGMSNQSHAGPHRTLHLCAFQIGLYSLGLHNKLTSNWLSRTYSSDVSWISAQAIEIGRLAIKILRETWESHFTPTEVANLADKASLSRDAGMAQAAADLALCALSHAHALNPTEIHRALTQCREQNTDMLEKACLAVEQAAKDGGVYPEILFTVAQQWYRLYCDLCAVVNRDSSASERPRGVTLGVARGPRPLVGSHLNHESSSASSVPSSNSGVFPHSLVAAAAEPSPLLSQIPQPQSQQQQQMIVYQQQVQQQKPTTLVDPQVLCPQTLAGMQIAAAAAVTGMPNSVSTFPFIQPFYAISGAVPLNFGVPASLAPFSPASLQPVGFSFPLYSTPQQSAAAVHVLRAGGQGQPSAAGVYVNAGVGPSPAGASGISGCFPPPAFLTSVPPPPLHVSHSAPNLAPSTPAELEREQNSAQYLCAAYRVGMLAMETMGRRISDERSYIKFSQNPPYGDDVRWLLNIAKRLGLPHVQQFCVVAAQSIVSPFVLWDLATDVALLYSRNAASQVFPTGAGGGGGGGGGAGCCGSTAAAASSMSSTAVVLAPSFPAHNAYLAKALLHPHVHPLLQRCLKMFYAAAHQKLSHPRFMQSDAEEVCTLVRVARVAFEHSPGGAMHFSEFLQSLRRLKACKKELWNQVLNALTCDSPPVPYSI